MLHHVGGVADDTGDQHLAGGQLDVAPHLPLVLVARIGALDHIGADANRQDEIDDVLERHVGGVRSGPAAPADVIADALGRQPRDGVVEHLHVHRDPFPVVVEASRRHHAVVGHRRARIVELQEKA